MNNAELNATRQHYRDNLSKGLDSVATVDWGSEGSQNLRFAVLGDVYDNNVHNDVLDVGCGLGGFLSFLNKNKQSPKYTGLDICPEMIVAMKKSHPNASGISQNIIETPLNDKWDLVVSSGIFNRIGSDDDNYTKKMIMAMWSATKKTLAWNMLSTKADTEGIAPTTRLSNPEYWYTFAKELTPHVKLRHDYLAHDFTLILQR